LAHASAILAPWGDSATIDALLSILGDSHPDVRIRGIAALGALAEPSDEVVLAAISACEQDTNESVCDAARKALEMLVAPDGEEPAIVVPQPCNIEGVKSKKATLFSVESLAREVALLSTKASAERLCMSRTSRVLLNVGNGLDRSRLLEMLASELPATLEVFRHPRARFISVTERSVRQLYHEHAGRTGLELLTALAPKQSLENVEQHLARFGLADKKSILLRSLPRSELVRLSLAAAFWPIAPHMLLLDDPGCWGLGASGLAYLSSALQSFSGGVLLASRDSELAKTFTERWTIRDGLVQREIPGVH
jgi:ATPase subunit of ABC transporter with duplicated ATPase domains